MRCWATLFKIRELYRPVTVQFSARADVTTKIYQFAYYRRPIGALLRKVGADCSRKNSRCHVKIAICCGGTEAQAAVAAAGLAAA